MAGILGEKHALLRRGQAAAHHKDILPGKKLPVARGAVGHAPALEGRLPGKAHFSGVGPGGPRTPKQDPRVVQDSVPVRSSPVTWASRNSARTVCRLSVRSSPVTWASTGGS